MIKHFLAVARAPFLLLPVTLVATGAAAAAWEGSFNLLHTLLALLGLVALHVAVNALNEASDWRTGIDLATERTPFSGGSGTLPAGHLSPRAAVGLGVGGAAVGLAVGAYFLVVIGGPLLPIVLLGALAVLTYTDLLARLYLGELFAGLGLGALPVAGSALVQDGSLGSAAVAAAVPAFFMTFNLLFLNEFPDQEADQAGGRRNLVLLFGRRGAALLYAAAALAVPLSLIAAVLRGALPPWALLALLPSLLLIGPLSWALGRPQEPVPVPALGANVAWNLLTNLLLATGLLLALWL
jgi:1,4-dihydroxy-2-naphthoate octaprenyltransferase